MEQAELGCLAFSDARSPMSLGVKNVACEGGWGLGSDHGCDDYHGIAIGNSNGTGERTAGSRLNHGVEPGAISAMARCKIFFHSLLVKRTSYKEL